MKQPSAVLSLVVLAMTCKPVCSSAQVDPRPYDRLTVTGNRSSLTHTDGGGGGSLNFLHYFTPDAILGAGAEHQYIAESRWTFGSLRGALGFGQPAKRFNISAEVNYGKGDESGRDFDYSVAVLGLSQAFTEKFSAQLEGRQIDIDKTHGNLPKFGLTYVWSPHVVTAVAYANSVGGNLDTELVSGRMDVYGRIMNFALGGASGQANPTVVNLLPGLNLPPQNIKEAFVGIGKTFSRGEVQLLGDYLEVADSKKKTLILSFTVYLGSRGR